ncbi:MAG: universal stress protein [Blastocatellia bacterium]
MNSRMKILLAYDGSSCADAALADLRHAGLPREAEAVVLSVAEHWLPMPPPSSYEFLAPDLSQSPQGSEAEALALAQRASDYVQSAFPAWEVRAEAASGSPARQVIEKAEQWQADLIVVGSHGHTGLTRLMLGSVSHKVAANAPCSVRITRGSADVRTRPVRIILGVDGSAQAELAVDAVATRAWPEGSEIKVISAIELAFTPTEETRSLPESFYSLLEKAGEEQAHMALTRAVERLRNRAGGHFAVTTEAVLGRAREVILQQAELWQADLIVLGSHGYGWGERFLFGSVALAVAIGAACSVEIVRRRAAENNGQNHSKKED